MVSWADVMPLLGQLHTRNTDDDAHGEAPAAAADEDEEAEEEEAEDEAEEEEEEEEASAGFPSTMVFIEVVSVRVLKTAEKQSRAPWMPSKVSLWEWGRRIMQVCSRWCVLEICNGVCWRGVSMGKTERGNGQEGERMARQGEEVGVRQRGRGRWEW